MNEIKRFVGYLTKIDYRAAQASEGNIHGILEEQRTVLANYPVIDPILANLKLPAQELQCSFRKVTL